MYLYILSNQVPLERKKKYVMIRKEVSEENGGMHYARNVVNNLPIAISIIIVWRILLIHLQNFCMLWILLI